MKKRRIDKERSIASARWTGAIRCDRGTGTEGEGPMQHGDVVTRLTREELYGRVWERPIRVLAQEFGISDVALAKTCRRAEVPVPGRGYWAKKAAGKPV